ncbi:MAG: MerC domain-containing protein [Bacteroidota bacterium]
MFLAVACAIHCALMPLIITLLPFAGLSFLASHTAELTLLGAGVGFAAYSVVRGLRVHRNTGPLWTLLFGAAVIAAGMFLLPHEAEPFLVATGALALGAAQIMNVRLTRACCSAT